MSMQHKINPFKCRQCRNKELISDKSFCLMIVQCIVIVYPLKECTLCVSVKYPLEGPPEVFVEDGINDGVETRVTVANPEEEFEQRIRYAASLGAHSLQRVRKEKGEPADDKHPHYYSQNKREPLLPVHHGLTP